EEPSIHPASAPRSNDPYAMVRDVAIAARDDDGDDTAVAEALEADRATRNNPNVDGRSGGNGGQRGAPSVQECAFTGFMKKMMMEEFCLSEEIQRLENELRSLKLRDTNIASYTQRFNELALLCPKAVLSEKKKVELYIKGLPKNIKGKQLPLSP
nr:reverse transcriptase domain-containing protein [Tanacetum cinerariifolium]